MNIFKIHQSTRAMLEFSKSILEKVSFDKSLFNKELRKLILWLGDDAKEVDALRQWCMDNFGHLYADSISEGFNKNRAKA
jgi:hypothetical protein